MAKAKLIQAIEKKENVTTTTNGMKAFKSTLNANVDMFSSIGGMRGQDPMKLFVKALEEDKEMAIRNLLWTRDARGGAGERELYRKMLKYLAINDYKQALELLGKTVELGRWDDVLVFHGTAVWPEAVEFIRQGLEDHNGLCAKWMPRKGQVAADLRTALGWTPKFYRKTLVGLTNVVETLMCAKEWDAIEYSKIPSVASARYQKAFGRNDHTRYEQYILSLEKGETTINAGAVYPYDVVKSLRLGNARVANQQWKALEDYVPEGMSFMPVVDVSGSMLYPAGGSKTVTCLEVAIGLGLYLSERNKSIFKDSFITFSTRPQLQYVSGTLQDRYNQMARSDWAMSTNLEAVFDLVLNAAVRNRLSQDDLPDSIIILSDMQFNSAISGKTAVGMIKQKYKAAGYEMPTLVFWNLRECGNKPAKADKEGVVLVSGFSPSIMKTMLTGKTVTPEDMMKETLLVPRYNFNLV